MNVKYTKEMINDLKEKAKTCNYQEFRQYIYDRYKIKLSVSGCEGFKQRYNIHCGGHRPRYDKKIIDYAKEKCKMMTAEQLRLDIQNKFDVSISYDNFKYFRSRHQIYCIDYIPNKIYTDKILNYARQKSKTMTIDELQMDLEQKFNFKTTRHNLQIRLYEYGIYCKNYKEKPIGHEFKVDRERTMVKIDNKSNNKHENYEYKHRLMYEKYHNTKLKSDDFIIFLDGNRDNLKKENLYKITKKEHAQMAGRSLYSKNKDLTKLAILLSQLQLKTKEKAYE